MSIVKSLDPLINALASCLNLRPTTFSYVKESRWGMQLSEVIRKHTALLVLAHEVNVLGMAKMT